MHKAILSFWAVISLIYHAVGDFDGDGGWEAAAVYRNGEDLTIAAYRHNGWAWVETGQWRISGYHIHTFYSAPSIWRGAGSHCLVIGWEHSGESYLSVYEWAGGTLQESARYPVSPPVRGWYEEERKVGLFPASVKTVAGTLWGYTDTSGSLVLPPVYRYAFDFQDNGLAIVEQNGKNGVIDKSGSFVAEPRYDYIQPFHEGLAIASDASGAAVMNESGQIISPERYENINSYSDGRALFTVSKPEDGQVYGYLDKEGKAVIPGQYLDGTDFREHKALVKVKDKLYRLIGLKGETLAEYTHEFVGPLSEGLLAFQEEQGGRYGYINEQGTVVIPVAYTGAQPFQDGRAVVNTAEDFGDRYGLIDNQGKVVVKPAYEDIRILGEGRTALGKAIDPAQPFIGSRYALADLDGRLLSEFVYYDVEDFKEGYASVNDGRDTFFIDKSGSRAAGLPVVPGTGTLAFNGSLIQANVDNRLSYLDRSGRVVWAQNTVIPLTPPYSVTELKYKPNKDYLVYYPQVKGMANHGAEETVNKRLKELSQVKPVDPTAQLDYSYTGDFQVQFYRGRLLVLLLEGYHYPFGAAHGMPSRVYTHTDLHTGRFYELKDLFKSGSDYVKVLSAIIRKQIETNPEYSYVWLDSYKGIAPDQLFYVTETALHLLFTPYEIAPYAAGFPEFTVPFAEIESILDRQGAFWQSFHQEAAPR
jgi:hypothetical protein